MKSQKYLILSAAFLGIASTSSAADVFTLEPGGSLNYTDPALWDGGVVPADGVDIAYNDGGVNVVVDSAVAPVHYIQFGTGSGTTVENTGSITTNLSQFASGTATINGSISGSDYSFVGDGGSNANVTVNGTWTTSQMFMGGFEGANSVSSLTIGDGGNFNANGAGLFRFSGGDNTDLSVNVNTGGTFTASSLRFGAIATATNRTATFNVAGGDVIINNGDIFRTVLNQDDVLVYDSFDPATIPDWANINYDGGTVTFTGLTTASDPGFIDAFTTITNAWVDNGFLTSNAFTNQQLKDGFSVTNDGAVLSAVPEPAAAGLVLALISALAVVTRRRR